MLEKGGSIFSSGVAQPAAATAKREAELYEQIGRLKMDVEWLKKGNCSGIK